MNKLLICIGLAFLVAACAAKNTNNPNPGSLNFNSNDWLLEKYKKNPSNPLNIEIDVTQTSQDRYFVKMDFKGDPQIPMRGINPSSVSFLSFCINNYVAQRSGNSAWLAGSKNSDLTPVKRYYSLIVGTRETLATIEKNPDLIWSPPVQTSRISDKCGRLIRKEYVK